MELDLPANNVSQQLFNLQLQRCSPKLNEKNFRPAPCCGGSLNLNKLYKDEPVDFSTTSSSPNLNTCIQEALFRQSVLSQYYNYLSQNNKLN